jgi:lysine-specific demethylase/histidyl-hydroxylase NO66
MKGLACEVAAQGVSSPRGTVGPPVIPDLDALFAPLGAAAFFAEHYERRPLHLPGTGGARVVLTHGELYAALAAEGRAPDGLVCFPEHVGATADELVADPDLLRAYLDAGHPLVWNRARGVAPGVDALSALLAEAFGAHVWPNVYATGPAGTPFDLHFDAHEVIAIQCEGDKSWWISEVRVDRPLDVAEMEAAVAAALSARRDEAAARPLLEVTVGPGDLVYVPRGQFHNARAAGGRSLHVTFGIRLPSGFDLARRVVLELLADPHMRELLPPRAADPRGEGAAERVAEIAARLRGALSEEALLASAEEVRRHWSLARRIC